jgi:hypothetical protein
MTIDLPSETVPQKKHIIAQHNYSTIWRKQKLM